MAWPVVCNGEAWTKGYVGNWDGEGGVQRRFFIYSTPALSRCPLGLSSCSEMSSVKCMKPISFGEVDVVSSPKSFSQESPSS